MYYDLKQIPQAPVFCVFDELGSMEQFGGIVLCGLSVVGTIHDVVYDCFVFTPAVKPMSPIELVVDGNSIRCTTLNISTSVRIQSRGFRECLFRTLNGSSLYSRIYIGLLDL